MMTHFTIAIIFSCLVIPNVNCAASNGIMRMRMEAGAQESKLTAPPIKTEYWPINTSQRVNTSSSDNLSTTLNPANSLKNGVTSRETSNPEKTYSSVFTCPSAQGCSSADGNECLSRCNTTSKRCNCQSLHLSSIPCNLPEDIESLNLGNNLIAVLGDCVLSRYRRLTQLVLRDNIISNLSENCFLNLSSLTDLNMEGNRLNLTDDTYPERVFEPLVSLQRLKINRNSNNMMSGTFSYPDKALSRLQNLTSLFVDGLHNKAFGAGFRAMTSLVNLTLAGYLDGFCNLGALTKDTLANLNTLQMLNISNCHLDGSVIDKDAFSPLTKLKILDLHYNENIGIENVAKITWGLRNSNLTYLDLSTTESRYSTGKLVNESHVMNLPVTLQVLKVAGNSIEKVDPKVFKLLPQNLSLLDVGKNKFVFGQYLCGLTDLKRLTALYLNGEDFLYNIPTTFPIQDEPQLRHSSNRQKRFAPSFICNGTAMEFPVPENLRIVEINNAGLEYRFSELIVTNKNSIQTLTFDRNYIPELIGPFLGFHNLIRLKISASFVKKMNSSFFANFPKLRFLHLNDNFLSEHFDSNDTEESVFQSLKNLEVLELYINEIQTLRKNSFDGLNSLKYLDLANNKLSNFTIDISHMIHLTHLNLSSNAIRELPPGVCNFIKILLNRNVSIRVDLSDNPIDCTCRNLEFLEWLANTQEVFGEYVNYKCVREDGSQLTVHDGYKEVLQILRRECQPNTLLFVLILTATILVLSVIIGLVLYRYRWTLRYLYHAAYLSYQQRKGTNSPGEYTYDVFISYANPDEHFVVEMVTPELEKRGLKVHVHGRNFVAGNFISSNIVSAVSASRKTLVILTAGLLKSHWCNYEVQMANMESVYSGRPVLVFLLKENIPSNKLGSLLTFIRNNTYMPYPQGANVTERERNAFWDKLAADLR